MKAGEFEEGTILPKIQAAVDFIGNSAIRKATIARLGSGKRAIAGTCIRE